MSEKNIIFFTHSLDGGGAEKTVRKVAKFIDDNYADYKVHVCVVYDAPARHGEVDNLIVLKTKSQPDDNKLVKGINVLKQISEMRNIKKSLGAKVCVSFLTGADMINVLSGVGEKKVISVRTKESRFTHSFARKAYIWFTYALCDRIVAVTDVVKKDCIEFFGANKKKLSTIYNSVDAAPVSGDDERSDAVLDFMSGGRNIICVGRLIPEKGHIHLIKAFYEASKEHPEYRLVVIGDGVAMPDCKEMIEKLGIGDKVMMVGENSYPWKYLRKADIFVLPSDIEGMANVLLEAMSCGIPCISTECGAREILAKDKDSAVVTDRIDCSDYGILVPNCNGADPKSTVPSDKEKLMADAMIMLMEDESMRKTYSEKGKEYVKEFSMERIGAQWVELLNELTK